MAMMIREWGGDNFEVQFNYKHSPLNLKESTACKTSIAPNSLMVIHEAIHVGPTRNFTWYTEKGLKSSVPTWTYPYPRPIIKHHNEEDGEIIGRTVECTYREKSALSNTSYLLIKGNVPDKTGKEGIKDGRLKTTSIGVIVHEARCSICNHNIAEEGPCEHERGSVYDDKTCYWMIENMEAKELSYVIVPSDIYSQVIDYYEVDDKGAKINQVNLKESFKQEGVKLMDLNNPENKDLTQTESVVVVEETEAEEAQATEAETAKTTEATKEEPKSKDLESEIEKLEAVVDKVKGELETAKEELKNEKAKNEEAQKVLSAKENALTKEIALRESLEARLSKIELAEKQTVAKQVFDLREKLGARKIAMEDLQAKSLEYLKESFEDLTLDLKESVEINKTEEVIVPTKVENPALAENSKENKTGVNVKENADFSNINVDELVNNIMSMAMNTQKN